MSSKQSSFTTLNIGKDGPDCIKRIIVIGAGLAGLSAARALAEREFEVVVLEGRNRIGGRCYTKDKIDFGAHWIHGTEGNPIAIHARQLGVDTLFVGGDSTYTGGWEHLALYGPDARVMTDEEKLKCILLADEMWDKLDDLRRRNMGEGREDLSIQEAIEQLSEQKSLPDTESLLVDWHIMLALRDDCAGDKHRMSFHWLHDSYEVYGYGDSVFVNGYGAFIQKLAEPLDIRLEHLVEEIRYDGSDGVPVRVMTSQGMFEGDAAVITLPLGLLKAGTVRFRPALPDNKSAAISRLGMGTMTKVIVRFVSPFWPPDQYVFGYLCKPAFSYPTTITNLWKTHRLPVLVMVIGGDMGLEVERWSDKETREWVLNVLKDIFGERVPEPVEISRTNWNYDPLSRGAYSYIALGATPADIDILAEPIDDRLFFAGEATSRQYWGSAHGAYASGLREAARITGDPTILPSRNFTENRRWREMMIRLTRFFNVACASTSGLELQEHLSILRDCEVFSAIPPTELQVLATMFEPLTFDSGEVICKMGERATQVYVIAEGEVEVRRADDSVITILRRGSVVGEYGMFSYGLRTATLVSRGKSRVLSLDYQRFLRFLLAFPESSLVLLKLTVERLINLERHTKSGPAL